MTGFFLNIVNMSISASWLIIAVLILRLFLKNVPKWINIVLWGLVALRLVLPISIESVMSIVPSAQTITMEPGAHRPYFESGFTAVDDRVNIYLSSHYFEGVTRPTGHFVDVTTILGIIWIVGMFTMLLYTVISYLHLKSKIATAVLLRDNILQSENVISPFVLGIIKPKIYLPFNMGIQDMVYVIAHENAHISRKDNLWKPLGFIVLTLHWFNPLVWLGYLLLCRDIELACDEKVVKEFDDEQKADYSQALLTCSANRRIIAACPLAFGEVGVKKRVKSVLSYKKPAFWIVIVAVIVCMLSAVCFLTNPTLKKPEGNNTSSGNASNEQTSDTDSETSSLPAVSKVYSKNSVWLACETINENGKPKKSTHLDPNGKKVAEINYDSEGNKTYTYFYEDGSVAPARTYDISWFENGTYQYRRFYYKDNGKPEQVSIYDTNNKLIGYRKYNDKSELIEEKGFDSESGQENYRMKYKYKYRADGTVSEIIFIDAREGNGKEGLHLETRFVNEEGGVYRATYYDGFSEEFSEPLIIMPIYYDQYEIKFYDEY